MIIIIKKDFQNYTDFAEELSNEVQMHQKLASLMHRACYQILGFNHHVKKRDKQYSHNK